MSEYIVERSEDEFGWDVYRVEADGQKTHVYWYMSKEWANRVSDGLADGTMSLLNGHLLDRNVNEYVLP
jgi:hypothetical protein